MWTSITSHIATAARTVSRIRPSSCQQVGGRSYKMSSYEVGYVSDFTLRLVYSLAP